MSISPRILLILRECGLPEPSGYIVSGGVYRWGKKYRYYLILIDEIGFCFGDWAQNFRKTYFFTHPDSLPKAERRAIKRAIKETRRRIDEENTTRQLDTASKAAGILKHAKPLQGICHPYLKAKNVAAHGIYLAWGDTLVIPMGDEGGQLWNVQLIKPDGTKRFLSGGSKKGCFFIMGNLDDADMFYVCEGYATGATIHAATSKPVVVAFDSGNIEPVLAALTKKYPTLKPIVAADNDAHGDKNTGLLAAKKAAAKYGCSYVYPTFL